VAYGQQAPGAGGVGGTHRAERRRLPVAAGRREIPLPDPGTLASLPAADGAGDDPVDPRVMAALLRLPARQRQVVALRLFLDLDTGRTAEVLGIAPGTVTAHLARAIAALRHDLMPVLPQETSS
jgi:DNA-directed RNA polymerase specialized sigma24 family protein